MKLLAKCPVCKCVTELQISDADKRIRCAVCRRLFKVPDTDTLTQALDRLAGASSDVFVDENGNLYG
jgi:transposase-like protein